jgi:hypothetical protein
MTPTLFLVLLLSQAEAPDDSPAGVVEPPVSDAPARYLARLDATGLTLSASVGLGVDSAR